MPGAPSRVTFDEAKRYQEVNFVGGTGRRLFDAEQNEMQAIRRIAERNLFDAIVGNAHRDNNDGIKLGDAGKVTPSGNQFTVNVENGYFNMGGHVVRTGVPGGTQEITVFEGSDAPGTEAAVYLQISETTIDSTGDPNIVDPTYAIETAHRIQRLVQILVNKPGTAAPAPGVGQTNLLLAVCTGPTPITDPLDAGEIVNARSIKGIDAITAELFDTNLVNRVAAAEAAIISNDSEIATNIGDITALDGRLTTAEADIIANDADHDSGIATNASAITALQGLFELLGLFEPDIGLPAQAVPDGDFPYIIWNSAPIDPEGWFTNPGVTVDPGIYLIEILLGWDSNSSGRRKLFMAARTIVHNAVSGDNHVHGHTFIYDTAVHGTTIQPAAFQNSGSVLNINRGLTRMYIYRLSNT